MMATSFVLLFMFCSFCKGGITEIPSKSEDEAFVEVITEDAWMPSNIFDVKPDSKLRKEKEIRKEFPASDKDWSGDSNELFKVLRNFLFAGDDGLEEQTEEFNEDPTEEIVKILEKGLIEATTMLLNPSEVEQSTTSSEEPLTDSISITKIENEGTDTLFDRIGLNLMNFANTDKRPSLSIINTTTACSTCYRSLETCVQQCFSNHNCHDVQRQAQVCPPPTTRMCNIFTQWSPVDECKENEDCKSPLLCCSDGCINKCSVGVWRD